MTSSCLEPAMAGRIPERAELLAQLALGLPRETNRTFLEGTADDSGLRGALRWHGITDIISESAFHQEADSQ